MNITPDVWLSKRDRIAILSDLHIGDGSASDLFGDKDELLLSVLNRESDAADVLVVNGDAIDHLQAGDNERIERAHPRLFEALRRVSRQRPVLYVLGNHEQPDDLRGAFPDFRYVHAVAVGEDLCITHGHQFDLNWAHGGESPWMVHVHTFLETYLRRPIRQPFRDYDNALNRVIHRLFLYYTRSLRLRGAAWRALGRPEVYEHWKKVDNFWARGQWGDLSCIFEMAVAYLKGGAPWKTLVLGHSHQPGVVPLGQQTYANVGSFALEQASFARVEQGAISVLDAWTGREYLDERYRMLISDQALPDMEGWFRRYYRGFFRYDLEAIRRDFPTEAPCDSSPAR